MAEYISLDGETAAVNAFVQMTTLGADAVSSVFPKGVTKIVQIRSSVSWGPDATAADKASAMLLLDGKGVVQSGGVPITIGACSGGVDATSFQANRPDTYDCDIDIVELSAFKASIASVGSDYVPMHAGVTLVLE